MWGCAILGTHFRVKKNLEGKMVVTNGDLWALLDICTPSFFCVMIVMQNFILINNHIKLRPENQQK